MSTLKFLRELQRQAAKLGVKTEFDTSVKKAHPKVVFTAPDGRTYSTNVASSPADAHISAVVVMRYVRQWLRSG